MPPYRHALLAAAIAAFVVSGCGAPPRLKTSSYEELSASLNQAKASLSSRDQLRFDEARRQFNAIYFPNGKGSPSPVGLADWRVVHDMTPGEFVSYVARLRPDLPLESESAFPSATLTSRLLAQYREEVALLRQNRTRQLESGKNTIDQYPIVDVAYVPPMSDVPMEYDKAAFLVSLRNDSGFDAYQPTVRIKVTDPKEKLPLMERTFTYPEKREPIDPGQTFTMRFECCSIIVDPLHNKLLKKASSDSSIEIELLGLTGHSGQPLVNTKAFSLADAQRMRVLDLCIKRIEANIAEWVPYAEADQPGGCGDPEQAENLIAMWQSQGVEPAPEFRHLVLKRPRANTAGNAPSLVSEHPVPTPHPDAADLASPGTPNPASSAQTAIAHPPRSSQPSDGSQTAVGSGPAR